MTTIAHATADMKSQWQALFTDYLAFYDTILDQSIIDQTWQRILDADQGMYALLAFHGPKAVGMANFLYHKHFWKVDDVCYLNDLFVNPNTRGSGVGRALIQACHDHAIARGTPELYWMTAHDNINARALYDKIGTHTPFIKYTKP